MVNWWFEFLGSPYERDCFLGAPLESQTTNPNHQFTICWNWENLQQTNVTQGWNNPLLPIYAKYQQDIPVSEIKGQTPKDLTCPPLKIVVGRLLSCWTGSGLRNMLLFGGVQPRKTISSFLTQWRPVKHGMSPIIVVSFHVSWFSGDLSLKVAISRHNTVPWKLVDKVGNQGKKA